MDEKYYAFWKYNGIPYLLGGEVTEFKPNGQVSVKGYTGMLFNPVKVVTLSKGLELQRYLDQAETIYREKCKLITDELNIAIKKICE